MTDNNNGLFTMVSLFGAMANGPANTGNRTDGKICTAQGGECRNNQKYYTMGMRDAKSWSMPHADDTCPTRCPYLQETPRDMGSSEERHERVGNMIADITQAEKIKRLETKLFMAMLGLDDQE
jgi:hypothetical protein